MRVLPHNMKSFYTRMCRTMLNIIRRCRIPRYLHPKSNHVYYVWTHMILLVIRQYESKSHRRLVQLSEECVGIREYLGFSKIPHYATLQKAAARLEGSLCIFLSYHEFPDELQKAAARLEGGLLHRMLQEFIPYKRVRLVLAGIDGSGFSYSTASYHYAKRVRLRRNFLKIAVCADMNSQLICAAIIHHGMQRDNPDFLPLLYKTSAAVAPVDTVLGDMGFDDESNHVGARKTGTAAAVIPTGHADVPIRRTSGTHRREVKRNFPRQLCSQRNRYETTFFVVKGMMSGDITPRNDTAQDNEILLGLIACNSYRVAKS